MDTKAPPTASTQLRTSASNINLPLQGAGDRQPPAGGTAPPPTAPLLLLLGPSSASSSAAASPATSPESASHSPVSLALARTTSPPGLAPPRGPPPSLQFHAAHGAAAPPPTLQRMSTSASVDSLFRLASGRDEPTYVSRNYTPRSHYPPPRSVTPTQPPLLLPLPLLSPPRPPQPEQPQTQTQPQTQPQPRPKEPFSLPLPLFLPPPLSLPVQNQNQNLQPQPYLGPAVNTIIGGGAQEESRQGGVQQDQVVDMGVNVGEICSHSPDLEIREFQSEEKAPEKFASSLLVGESLTAVSLSPDKTMCVVAGRNVFNLVSVDPIEGLKSRKNLRARHTKLAFSAQCAQWNKKNNYLIASGSANGKIVIWDLGSTSRDTIPQHSRSVNAIRWHPEHPVTLMSGGNEGTIKILDLRYKDRVVIFEPKQTAVRDLAFSPHYTNYLIAGFETGVVQVWDIRRYSGALRSYTAHNRLVVSVDWHPAAPSVFATAGDALIKLWNLDQNSKFPIHTIQTPHHVGPILWRQGYSTQICSSSSMMDSRIHVWDTRRPYIPYAWMAGHSDVVTSMTWFDSDMLISCSKDLTLKLQKISSAHYPLQHVRQVALAWCTGNILAYSKEPPQQPDTIVGPPSASQFLPPPSPDRFVQVLSPPSPACLCTRCEAVSCSNCPLCSDPLPAAFHQHSLKKFPTTQQKPLPLPHSSSVSLKSGAHTLISTPDHPTPPPPPPPPPPPIHSTQDTSSAVTKFGSMLPSPLKPRPAPKQHPPESLSPSNPTNTINDGAVIPASLPAQFSLNSLASSSGVSQFSPPISHPRGEPAATANSFALNVQTLSTSVPPLFAPATSGFTPPAPNPMSNTLLLVSSTSSQQKDHDSLNRALLMEKSMSNVTLGDIPLFVIIAQQCVIRITKHLTSIRDLCKHNSKVYKRVGLHQHGQLWSFIGVAFDVERKLYIPHVKEAPEVPSQLSLKLGTTLELFDSSLHPPVPSNLHATQDTVDDLLEEDLISPLLPLPSLNLPSLSCNPRYSKDHSGFDWSSNKWALQTSLLEDIVRRTLLKMADSGEVQLCALVALVLGQQLSLPNDTISRWVIAYIELLRRHQLILEANEVIHNCSPTICAPHLRYGTAVAYSNQQTIPSACPSCKRHTKRGWCSECKLSRDLCSICHQPVRNAFLWCQGCGHGGHLKHLSEWFSKTSRCPAGCGHKCTPSSCTPHTTSSSSTSTTTPSTTSATAISSS
ncbi:GATOR complex protein WDR24 [Pelomyxa schiedti]|nr:GATOR complex protein WDR24 [Pelomyxa schiedti]